MGRLAFGFAVTSQPGSRASTTPLAGKPPPTDPRLPPET